MKVTDLALEGLKKIELVVHGDARGFFIERFNMKNYLSAGLPVQFCQDNHSRSAVGVLRGLHFQTHPSQGKLVGVLRGKILDVVVDIRPQSVTYGQSYSQELSDKNGVMLWVPAGFAHGFYVMGAEPADVLYKVDAYYNPSTEGGIRWNDPDLKISWPTQEATVSERDSKLPSWRDYAMNPALFPTYCAQ